MVMIFRRILYRLQCNESAERYWRPKGMLASATDCWLRGFHLLSANIEENVGLGGLIMVD